jgi:hypothetical protein
MFPVSALGPSRRFWVHWKNVRSNGESGSKERCVEIVEACLKLPTCVAAEVKRQFAQTTLMISRVGFVPPRLANAN